jgi:hypothetical protein
VFGPALEDRQPEAARIDTGHEKKFEASIGPVVV